MGPLGWQETVAIFVLALLFFGPKKLPELGRTIAKALAEFRRASTELKATFEREMQNLERENESLREVTQSYQNQINNYEDSSYYDGAYGSDSGYGSESYDSTATDTPHDVSASATEGAESPAITAGEDTTAIEVSSETAALDVPEHHKEASEQDSVNGQPSHGTEVKA